MAFSLGWAGAPIGDFDDQELNFGLGEEDRQKGENANSDTGEGQHPGGDLNDSFAGIHAGKGKEKASNKTRAPAGVAKKLSLDYDSDDGRLIELKKQGHSDDYVAQKFVEEGRIKYQAKTINSRWLRFRKLLTQQDDERLDDELSDWHEGEDEQLDEIVKAIAPKFDHQIQLLEERRWHEISLHLGERLGQRKYTGKACRERVAGIQDGTALPPIELAEDPEARRQMRDERVTAAKKARQDAKDAQRAKEHRAEARVVAKKQEAAEAQQRKIDTALQKRAEKEEAERIKEERKENKEKIRQHRIAMLAQFRAEKEWRKTRKQAEKDLYRQLTGYSINGSRPGRIRKSKEDESEEELDDPDNYESDDEEAIVELGDDDSGDGGQPSDADDEANFEQQINPDGEALSTSKKTKAPAVPANQAGHIRATVTKATLLNPRSIMTSAELGQILTFRNLKRRGGDESHAEVVARIAANDESLKSEELSQLLLHASERSKGTKTAKIERLRRADARGCDAGQMGVTSRDLDFVRRYEGYRDGFEDLVREMEMEVAGGGGGDVEVEV